MAQDIKPKLDIDPSKLSDKEKQDLLLSLRRLGGKQGSQKRPAPTTDDELWDWIVEETGFEIPRVAVCDDHTAPFDYVADYYFERESAILVIGGRESAKCVCENSLIYNVETGERKKIKDFINEDINKIPSMDKDGNIIVSDIDAKIYTGEKECLKVTTVSGRQIEVTPEHPFMTQDGWCRSDEIEVGDAIAIPAFIPFQINPVKIPDSDVVLLAGLLSEGSISQVQTGFSTGDEYFLELMTKASEEKLCKVTHRSNYDYAIVKNIGSGKRNPVSRMLGEYGIDYTLAKNKYIPDIIFRINKDQLAKFISIFWMADGCIEEKSVTMCLASEQLIKDFQHLLLKFGIQSRYKYRIAKFEDKEYDSWKLEIYGNHVEKFSDSFSLWGYKKDKLQNIVEKNRCPSAGRPPLTSSLLNYFKLKTPQRKHGTGKKRTIEAYEQLGWKPERSFGTRILTRGKVKNLQARRLRALCHAHEINESEFSVLLNEDLWWDFIVEIEPVGIKKVYDLTVSSTESFVANDIVVHNTLNTAIANYVFAETKPGCEICTFADIEAQSNKSYSYIKSFVYTNDSTGKKVVKPTVEGVPLRKETLLKNGSKLEVIIGTLSGVNSPHPQKVHADEVDLQDREIFRESRNMSSSKTFPDGRVIKAQDIATSTLKSTKGIVQELVDETKKAISEGLKATWKIYISCVFEVAKEVPSCRSAPKDQREARLIELGKDPCELCECNKVAKGQIAEKVPRTLESVCQGKFFKSRGWMSYEDVVRKFVQNIPSKWASQLECRRPMADGLYLPTWSRERYCIRGYEPRPEYGYIWMGVDWGGQENNSILWIQGPLHQPLQVNNTLGTKTIIPQDAYVIFKEINLAAVGATRLADMVVRQEIQYKNRFGGSWRVKARFADMAGRQSREDWREHTPPLITKWYLTGSKEGSRSFEPTVECIQGLVTDSLLYVDDQNCPGTCDDFESWRSKDNKEIHDESSHNPAACFIAGTKVKTNNGDKNIELIKPGEFVYTRDGLKEVEWSGKIWDTPRPIRCVKFSNGSELIGTDNHPVWVKDKGFVHLAALRYGDIIESWTNQSSAEKTYGTTGSGLLDGLNQRIRVIKDITKDTIAQKESRSKLTYTDIFGKITTGRSPMEIISTTLMKIGIITIYPILNVCPPNNISVGTTRDVNTRLLTDIEKLDQKIYWNPNIGAGQEEKKLEKKREGLLLKERRLLNRFVRYAKKIIKQKILNRDFVQINVSQNGVVMSDWIILQKFVQLVEKSLKLVNINCRVKKLVPVSVVAVSEPIGLQYVYDLSIKDKHEFYANGILVHNCRYALKNITTYIKRTNNGMGRQALQPVVAARDSAQNIPGALATVSVGSPSSDEYSSEAWRSTIGAPAPGEGDKGKPNWMP